MTSPLSLHRSKAHPPPAHKPPPAAIVGGEAFKRDGPVGGGRRVPSRSHRGDTPPSGQYPKGGLDVRGYCHESHRAVLSLRDGASNTIAARTASPSRKDTLSSPNNTGVPPALPGWQ